MNPKYVGKKVGFTGTQRGMTYEQKKALRGLLDALLPTHFSHGDCVGADDEACNVVADLYKSDEYEDGITIVRHPPTNGRKRAYNDIYDEDRRPKDYHSRNRDIVDENDLLIGCPKFCFREAAGGTWWTIGYCEGKKKPRFVVWPDGKVSMPEDSIP